ncbi:MAG: SecDF P1 head subdomain-containing protein [Planctomycetota bacterium]
MTISKTLLLFTTLVGLALPACTSCPAETCESAPIVFRMEVPEGTEGAVAGHDLEGAPGTHWFGEAHEFPLGYAGPTRSSKGAPAVAFEIVAHKQDDFADFTEQHKGKRMAIVIDGEIIAAPTIADRLPGSGILEGGAEGFTEERVEEIAHFLRTNG